MVGSAKYALPEHWTELSAARAHRRQCADQVDAIKRRCATECRKEHVTDCADCFPETLDKMRARYCDGQDREWFSQRRAFLDELDMLFTDAKDHKNDLKSIEDHIEMEKEAWYRWVLRTYPEFLTAGDSGVDQEELRGMLDDPDRSREELIERVWEGVGRPDGWYSDVDMLADKIAGPPSELKKLYIDLLFKDSATGEVMGFAQKYLDAYQSSDNMPIEEVINQIAQDHRASMNTKPQRDVHEGRLNELRRAKMAFEQNKQQTKGQSQAGQTPVAAEELYHLPPCAVCSKVVEPKDVFSCSLCQVITQIGGRKRLTVYCSNECYHSGQDDHVEKEHDCEAGERCVQNFDDDVMMEDGTPQTVICNDCVGEKQSTIYCSERCARQNLAGHREAKHGVKTQTDEIRTLVSPLWELVEKTLKEGNPGLKFSIAE